MASPRSRVLALVAFAALAACDQGSPEEEARGASSDAEAPPPAIERPSFPTMADAIEPAIPSLFANAQVPGVAAFAPPSVQLVEPGAEPRRPVRYALPPGSRTSALVTTSAALTAAGQPQGQLRIDVTFDLEQIGKARGDQATYQFVLKNAELVPSADAPAQAVQMMKQALQRAEGLEGWLVVDAAGFARRLRIHQAESLPPELLALVQDPVMTLARMFTPLPAAPIGPGAVWEVEQRIEHRGLFLDRAVADRTTRYQLTALQDGRGTVQATITESAGTQRMPSPPEMPGMTAELRALRATGTGTVQFDLDTIVPNARLQMVTDYTIAASFQGRSQEIEMHVEAEQTIAPR